MGSLFISDPHFGHANIIKYSNRPFNSVEDMNEKLIANWNHMVKDDDDVYQLGDFAFLPYEESKKILRRLNGRKHFMWGNHDERLIEKQKELLALGLLTSSQYCLELRIPGTPMIVLFHYGCRVWRNSHKGSIHLYGHSHGSLPPHGKSVDVGVDCKEITEDYRPIALSEILSYMEKRDKSVVDHHGKSDK